MNESEARLRSGHCSALRSAGMSAAESSAKAALLEKLTGGLRELRGVATDKRSAFFVPGRIEVLGKHTDYAGGRSIVCAIERGICIVAAPRADAQVRIVDLARDSGAQFALDPDAEPALGQWSNYAVTVARRVGRDFPAARVGADIVFASDLPPAAGMSSSSALIVAVFFAIADANWLWQDDSYRRQIESREDLAGYLSAIESGGEFASFSGDQGVGTFGGSEDHVAILCSRAGFLRQYSYCPVRLEKEIPMPEGYSFVIGASGVKADKTGNALDPYNRISLAARRIGKMWRRRTGRSDTSLAAALSSGLDAGKRLRQIVRDSADSEFPVELLLSRLNHFEEESNEIVPAACEAIARGEMESFGDLVDRSQSLAESSLGNQTLETSALARSARALGAVAASAFGAGFGGSVWAFVSSNNAEEFRAEWSAHYCQRFPDHVEGSQFFITSVGPGLIRL